ncbi:hypothetical protein PVAG01_11183 [Phlyctema vagabunda]|uniref:Uncharacterized protein n=1 Tax=Phlyctema vagabunda TaxID=108571 RepID=A0ABR4P1L3_9HELO
MQLLTLLLSIATSVSLVQASPVALAHHAARDSTAATKTTTFAIRPCIYNTAPTKDVLCIPEPHTDCVGGFKQGDLCVPASAHPRVPCLSGGSSTEGDFCIELDDILDLEDLLGDVGLPKVAELVDAVDDAVEDLLNL